MYFKSFQDKHQNLILTIITHVPLSHLMPSSSLHIRWLNYDEVEHTHHFYSHTIITLIRSVPIISQLDYGEVIGHRSQEIQDAIYD